MLLQLVIAFLAGLLIAWTYRRTHRGFSYSQSFATTLVLLTAIAALIFIFIKDNVAVAIGIFGAFSIIRFRTAVKEPRDTAFVFFALAIGLGVGVNLLSEAVLGCLAVTGIILLLDHLNLGSKQQFEYLINFKLNTEQGKMEDHQNLFDQLVKRHDLISVATVNHELEISYHATLKGSVSNFIAKLDKLSGIKDINLVQAKNDLEY